MCVAALRSFASFIFKGYHDRGCKENLAHRTCDRALNYERRAKIRNRESPKRAQVSQIKRLEGGGRPGDGNDLASSAAGTTESSRNRRDDRRIWRTAYRPGIRTTGRGESGVIIFALRRIDRLRGESHRQEAEARDTCR